MNALTARLCRFDRASGLLTITTSRGSVELLVSKYEGPNGEEMYGLLRLSGDCFTSRVEVRLGGEPRCSCGVEPCDHLDSMLALRGAGRI